MRGAVSYWGECERCALQGAARPRTGRCASGGRRGGGGLRPPRRAAETKERSRESAPRRGSAPHTWGLRGRRQSRPAGTQPWSAGPGCTVPVAGPPPASQASTHRGREPSHFPCHRHHFHHCLGAGGRVHSRQEAEGQGTIRGAPPCSQQTCSWYLDLLLAHGRPLRCPLGFERCDE